MTDDPVAAMSIEIENKRGTIGWTNYSAKALISV